MGETEEAFQTIALPAGRSHIAFAFRPRGFNASLIAAGLALLLVLAVGLNVLSNRIRHVALDNTIPVPAFARRRAAADIGTLRPIMKGKKARAYEKAESDHVVPPDRFT